MLNQSNEIALKTINKLNSFVAEKQESELKTGTRLDWVLTDLIRHKQHVTWMEFLEKKPQKQDKKTNLSVIRSQTRLGRSKSVDEIQKYKKNTTWPY